MWGDTLGDDNEKELDYHEVRYNKTKKNSSMDDGFDGNTNTLFEGVCIRLT